jgi:uncharacterized protein YegP (UPF0339 family)
MATRFELVLDHEKFRFVLRAADGQVLLNGLPGTSKIMVQNDILHLRSALRDGANLVPHRAADGSCFLTVKDKDGAVLARSPQVATDAALAEMAQAIPALAAKAPIVDLTKHAPAH